MVHAYMEKVLVITKYECFGVPEVYIKVLQKLAEAVLNLNA